MALFKGKIKTIAIIYDTEEVKEIMKEKYSK